MAEVNLGFCGSSIRFLLIIINVLFFLMGLIVFIIAAVLKWTTVFNTFVNIKEIETLVKLGSIESVATVLLIVSVFAMIVSVVGMIGAKYANKFFLITYEIIVVLLFLTHGIAALVVAVGSSKLQSEFSDAMNKTIDNINSNETMPDVFDKDCNLMRNLSSVFKCCGANGPWDFTNATFSFECCAPEDYQVGCTDKIIKDVVEYSIHMIVVPSVIILLVEIFAILMVPILICRASKRGSYENV